MIKCNQLIVFLVSLECVYSKVQDKDPSSTQVQHIRKKKVFIVSIASLTS